MSTPTVPITTLAPVPGEPVFRQERLTASYLHTYFPSCPAAAASLFQS